MNFDNPATWVLGGLAAVALVCFGTHYFSNDARLERRRRKNNARVVSTSRRPTVKFSVHTDQKKRGGKSG